MEDIIYENVLKATEYGGAREPERKRLTASGLSTPMLQEYLKYMHGVPNNKEIDATTIGSLGHLACEQLLQNLSGIQTEVSLSHKFDNGWELSGSMDVVNLQHRWIGDFKFTKFGAGTKVKAAIKSGKHHDYIVQLNVYRYLYKKIHEVDMKMRLYMFYKDGGVNYKTGGDIPHNEIIEIPLISDFEITEMFMDKVKALEGYIELNETPSKCTDIYHYSNKAGVNRDLRCELWCSYSDVCPYYEKQQEF